MIWYSNVNEDSTVERNIVHAHEPKRVFCIVGSGERLIALLGCPTVQAIHAIDVNREAMNLLALKLAALRNLGVDGYLRFCGFENADCEERSRQWRSLRDTLEPSTRKYWDDRLPSIREGVVDCGHFERFLARMRPFTNRFLGAGFQEHRSITSVQLTAFPTRRWAVLKRLFSLRLAYLLLGIRDPAFVSADANVAAIPHGLQSVLDRKLVSESFMWHLVFIGHFREMEPTARPPSVQRPSLNAARNALLSGQTTVHFHTGDLLRVLRALDREQLSKAVYSLSDLLSFCDFSYLTQVVQELVGSNSTVVVRSFLKNDLTREHIEMLRRQGVDTSDRSCDERTCMYHVHALNV